MTLPSDMDIQPLIELAQSGNQEAIGQLYERYVDRIYRYIAYRVPDSEAEDLTAEVFVRVIAALPHYVYTGAPFEAWLYRIASARVADHHRSAKDVNELPDELTSDDTQPERRMILNQEHATVREALQQLTDDEQTLLILRFVERQSHKEVAEFLNKTVAAVRTMQHRALHRLAQLLNAEKKERHYLRGEQDDLDAMG